MDRLPEETGWSEADVRIADDLLFLAPGRRRRRVRFSCAGTSSLGHVMEALLRPGTRRTYQTFSRCADCGREYWRRGCTASGLT